MGNLGWYQLITTAAKKVGGPKRLIALTLGTGAAIHAGACAAYKKVKKELDKKKRARAAAIVYTVEKEGSSNEGLLFRTGERFKVLEIDGDACLIEKLGDNKNPYFVSLKFLSSISDYVTT